MASIISITGPESTGKSTLSKWLSMEVPRSVWVEEYARWYLSQNGPAYDYQKLISIAENQINQEIHAKELADTHNMHLVFLDTDAYVLYVWFEVAYGRCPDFITQYLESKPYDWCLLCDIDWPWEADELREHPNERPALMKKYLEVLTYYGQAHSIVKGEVGEERKQMAKQALAIQGFIK